MKKTKMALLVLPLMIAAGPAFCNVGSTIDKATEQTSQFITDTAITAKVKSELLADKDIKSFGISVSTEEGVVTLTGDVENRQQKDKAVRIASQVKGVKMVKDEIVLKQ